ncbi:MAG: phosphoenolpyruvate carboxylase, partial [Sandarakinorhabdus sp.]
MIEACRQRLGELHVRTAETPLFNPVFQLGLEISRQLEKGEITLAALSDAIAELGRDGLAARADRLARLIGPLEEAENLEAFRAAVTASAQVSDFAAFAARWSQPLLHVVFTAHPTFLLTRAEYAAVAAAAVSGTPVAIAPQPDRPSPSLADEHDEAMAALTRAGSARDRLHAVVLDVAAAHYPDDWRRFTPCLFRLATWVGYDMDGRTDIGWATSLRFRLDEKARRLALYADTASAVGEAGLADQLRRAGSHAATMAALLAGDTETPAALSAIANQITAPHADSLTLSVETRAQDA